MSDDRRRQVAEAMCPRAYLDHDEPCEACRERVAAALAPLIGQWREQDRQQGADEERGRIQEAAAAGCNMPAFHPVMCRCLPGHGGSRCWAMADDDDPDCPIGSARCVRPAGHDGDHVWEAPALRSSRDGDGSGLTDGS